MMTGVHPVIGYKSALEKQSVISKLLLNLRFIQTCSSWDRNNSLTTSKSIDVSRGHLHTIQLLSPGTNLQN